MTAVAEQRPIRSSFDLWGGVSAADIANSVSCDLSKRHSLQIDPAIGVQLSCPPLTSGFGGEDMLTSPDTSELMQLLQHQQQQQQAAAAGESSCAEEQGIDAQIQRLLQLKQFLRRNKQTAGQHHHHHHHQQHHHHHHQHQQVILEDMALAPDASLDTSSLFASGGGLAAAPLQSDSLLSDSTGDLQANGWGHLAAARAAARPSRASIDMGGLAQQLAALEMSNNAAAAALADSQALAGGAGMRMNSRMSLDCGAGGLPDMTTDNLLALAAAANAQAVEATRRASLCLASPQVSGLLDNMVMSSAGGAALAMQSALYGPSAPAMDAQLQAPASSAGLACFNMPSPAAMAAVQRFPARQSLDCSLLGGAAGLSAAGLGAMAGLPSPGPGRVSGLPSPVCSRTSLSLPQAPLLADRGMALVPPPQTDASGWGFADRRRGGRASFDVRRGSSDLPRSLTPAQREPPRKSVSMLNPGVCSSSSAGSSSGSSSGRSSPRSKVQPQQQGNARRASMDCKPPTQPLKPRAPAAGEGAAAASTSAAAAAARKGTGVFIPACMLNKA